LLHRQHSARAACEQAAQAHRSIVLTALQNVGDTLAALTQDADTLKAAAAAERSAADGGIARMRRTTERRAPVALRRGARVMQMVMAN
jgi:hypothetical protein